MLLVAVFDVFEYLQCLDGIGWLDEHFLEASLECSVFFDAVAIFVECGGSDALDGASCECRFEDVGSVH